ncbi:MAG: hypothetical protein M3281_03670, partial [Chloroflexota bacterium]|nr:hypothetical protein [Chloroflexota bacterium]
MVAEPGADGATRINDLLWSPSGDWITVSFDGRARLLDASQGYTWTNVTFPQLRRAQWSRARDSERLLWVGRAEAGHNGPMHVYDVQDRSSTSLPAAAHAAWLPDGSTVLYSRYAEPPGSGMELLEVPAAGGQPSALPSLSVSGRGLNDLQFSPDGKHLALVTSGGQMRILDWRTGETEVWHGSEAEPFTAVRWGEPSSSYTAWLPRLDEQGLVLYTEFVTDHVQGGRRLMVLD